MAKGVDTAISFSRRTDAYRERTPNAAAQAAKGRAARAAAEEREAAKKSKAAEKAAAARAMLERVNQTHAARQAAAAVPNVAQNA
eukprot:COSAG04_NODE_3965_length_2391_cov_1.925393_3_plen_84_part_01